jgi:hypothetical protein
LDEGAHGKGLAGAFPSGKPKAIPTATEAPDEADETFAGPLAADGDDNTNTHTLDLQSWVCLATRRGDRRP